MGQVIKPRPLPFRACDKWGFIDIRGSTICEAKYDYAGRYSEGFGYVDQDGTIRILDAELEVVGVVQDATSIASFSQGLLRVESKTSGRSYFVDTCGRRVFRMDFDNCFSFSNDRAIVEVEDRWGMLDRSGKWIVRPIFASALPFQPGVNTTAASLGKGRSAILIDKSGGVVSSQRFDILRTVNEGLVPFAQYVGGRLRFGVADDRGNVIVPPTYHECDSAVHEGVLGVEVENGKWGVIDRAGAWVIQPGFIYVGECREGLLLAYDGGSRSLDGGLRDGKFGYISLTGKPKIRFQFDDAGPFLGGIADIGWDVPGEDIGTLGYVRTDGRLIWRECLA